MAKARGTWVACQLFALSMVLTKHITRLLLVRSSEQMLLSLRQLYNIILPEFSLWQNKNLFWDRFYDRGLYTLEDMIWRQERGKTWVDICSSFINWERNHVSRYEELFTQKHNVSCVSLMFHLLKESCQILESFFCLLCCNSFFPFFVKL